MTDRIESSQRALHLLLLDLQSGQRRLLDYPRADQQADYHPRLSPDRQHWAFLRSAPRATELWMMRVDGSESRRVARFAGGLMGYDWLADGRGWLLAGASSPQRPWWQLSLDGRRQALPGVKLQYPQRAAGKDYWVAEEPPSPGRLWRHGADQAGWLAPSETGSDAYPTPHPEGGLLFVSSRRGRSELWWQAADQAPQPLGEAADQFGRPQWWDAETVVLPVRQGDHWHVQRRRLADGRGEQLDLSPYQILELAAVDGQWFAIGRLNSAPAKSELLRLRESDGRLRAEPTGIAAIAVRAGAGQLWIRQYLQRGVRRVHPLDLRIEPAIGEVHFSDWQIDDDGLLFWNRLDLLRHELVWFDPDGRRPSRVELPATDAWDPFAGMARAADGSILSVRLDAAAGDLHQIRLETSDQARNAATNR